MMKLKNKSFYLVYLYNSELTILLYPNVYLNLYSNSFSPCFISALIPFYVCTIFLILAQGHCKIKWGARECSVCTYIDNGASDIEKSRFFFNYINKIHYSIGQLPYMYTYVNIDVYNIYVIFHDIICFSQHFSALRTLVEKITIRLIVYMYTLHMYIPLWHRIKSLSE